MPKMFFAKFTIKPEFSYTTIMIQWYLRLYLRFPPLYDRPQPLGQDNEFSPKDWFMQLTKKNI